MVRIINGRVVLNGTHLFFARVHSAKNGAFKVFVGLPYHDKTEWTYQPCTNGGSRCR